MRWRFRNEDMERQSVKICKKCGCVIRYVESDTYWDESGYMYSTKLVDCTECGTPIVLKYEEDSWLADYD